LIKRKQVFSAFFAWIVLPQLDGLFLNEKLIFLFWFLNIAGQQGLNKITTRFGKHMACPHED